MNEQPQHLNDDQVKEMVKGREHEFTYLVVPCVETFQRGLEWTARLVLARREDSRFALSCALADVGFQHIPDEIQKWEKTIGVH